MYRLRIRLPKGQAASYRYLDLLHNALVNAWIAAGAAADEVIGAAARPWNFAALGWHRKDRNSVHTLVVSTPDPDLAKRLRVLDPASIRYARAITAELVDFSAAEIFPEEDPILPGQETLGLLLLSPLLIRVPGEKRWHKSLNTLDLATAINPRLSRLSGRPVRLQIQADPLYLRANPDHSVLVPLKQGKNGQMSFIIGMSAPLVLAGNEADLRLAWYAGIGEKMRNGFGCLGLVEQGVGR
jgi:CRISPR-associated endoribonuclease Cas6